MINQNPSNAFNIDQGLPSTTQINRAHSTEYVREFISLIVGDSLNVWEAHVLAPNRRFTSRVFVRGVEFTDETIVDFRIEETVNPDDSFMIGSVGATKLELTLLHTEEKPVDAVENAVIRPEIALEVDGEFVYLPMGVYYAEKVDKKKGSIKITAFDSMVKFEKPYISHLTYPANIQGVAEEICSRAGVTFASTLPNIQINEITGYTLRQALSFIASFVGGFARFDRDGELEIKGYDTFIEKVYPSNYFDLQTPENTFTIGRLTCKVGENEEGEIIELTTGTDGNEVYFENPIMTQAQLESVFSTLQTINYLPYELNWQGDPALQAGDRIRITDANGVVFESLVMEQQIKYNGGFSATASAKAKSETAQEFSSTGTLTQKVERQEKEIVYTKKEIKRTAEEITADLNTRIGDVNDNIDSLLSRADGVDGTLVTINQEIDDINGSLSSTITEISNINGVVSEHTTTLEQHAGAIAAKAEKTEVYTKTETNGLLDDKVNVTVYNNKMTALDLTIDGLNTTVSNTVANVDTLTGNVTSALSQIGELDLRADGFETSISEINGDLSGVEGRLSTAEGSITALAGEVALKATKTEVDTIEGRLSTAEGSITTMAGQISSKAEASEVTALGTKITTVEENIDAINGELTNKVSTTDYNGNTIASLINQTATTVTIDAAKINLVGAVTVLSDISGNLGTVTAGTLRGTELYQTSGLRELQLKQGRLDSYYNSNLAMSFGQYRLNFYAIDGGEIGYFGPNNIVDSPEIQGLSLVSQRDYVTIGKAFGDLIRPSFRVSYANNYTMIAGPHNTTSSELVLYANSYYWGMDRPSSRSNDQAAITLDQSATKNDIINYFGGYTNRDNSTWEVRYNGDATTSQTRIVAHDEGVTLSAYNTGTTSRGMVYVLPKGVSLAGVNSNNSHLTRLTTDGDGVNLYGKTKVNGDIEVGSNLLIAQKIATAAIASGGRHLSLWNSAFDGKEGVLMQRGDTGSGILLTDASAYLMSDDNHNAYFRVSWDATGNFVQTIDIYNRHYSGDPNVFVTNLGTLGRSVSALKYKVYVKPVEIDGYAERILKLNPKSWYDKTSAEAYADYLSGNSTEKDLENIPQLRRHYGLIAEDLVEAGLNEYVTYHNGEVEGIEYSRLWTLLIPVVRDLKIYTEDEINWLKMENQLLRSRVTKLENLLEVA